MTKIAIRSTEPDDIKVLGDLLRAYFPNAELKHVYDKEEFPDAFDIKLDIRRHSLDLGYGIILGLGGMEYCQDETLPFSLFEEEELNRKKRLLRLTIHKALAKYYRETNQACQISPWGVLTGVRPTKIVHRMKEQGIEYTKINAHLLRDFGIDPETASLLTRVAKNQEPYLPVKKEVKNELSLYIGIPFCPTRCHYCSFPAYSMERWSKHLDGYLHGLLTELKIVGEYLQSRNLKVKNIYFGGGTPTILSAKQLELLLEQVHEKFPVAKDRELTVEAGRPDTLDLDKLQLMKSLEVSRLSINPQTMHDETLLKIGRRHTVKDVISIYELARKIGFPVINMDMIIGLPGEDLNAVQSSITELLRLRPDNITIHALALKRAALYKQERIERPQSTEGRLMNNYVRKYLQEDGYEPYYLYRQKDILAHGENVGYSLPGKYCRYNILMMEERQTILGFGVGAGSKIIDPITHSVDNFYNPKDLFVYLDRLEENANRKVDKLESFG